MYLLKYWTDIMKKKNVKKKIDFQNWTSKKYCRVCFKQIPKFTLIQQIKLDNFIYKVMKGRL